MPMVNLLVRNGTRSDAETIAEFQINMAKETEGLSLDTETVRQGVEAVFDDPAKGRYWIAEIEGETVAGMLTVPEWSDWRNGTVLWIHSVYVRPEVRRQGVFRKLYRHLRDIVQADESLIGLRLYVDKRNEIASKVYEALGMDGQHYRLYEWLK
jgi:GNAT superfamily N-acetyltransferase